MDRIYRMGNDLYPVRILSACTQQGETVNYLQATGIDVGLLISFGTPRVEHHRLYRPDGPGDPRAGTRTKDTGYTG